MGAVEPLTLHCPACSEPISIPVSVTPGAPQDNGAIPVAVGFDRGAALAHIEQHLMVTQTIFADDPQGRQGNCLQAAVASLLVLPLDEVPHFIEHEDWLGRMTDWAGQRGYAVTSAPGADGVPLGIAYGPSPRGVTHAVVVRDGAIAWDPHPSRAGLVTVSGVYEFTKEAS